MAQHQEWHPAGFDLPEQWFIRRSLPAWERHIRPLAPFRRYLEIGVCSGMSLAWTALNLLTDDGTAFAVDSWQPIRPWGKWVTEARAVRDRFDANLQHLKEKCPGVLFVTWPMDSATALAKMLAADKSPTFDLIYCDGGHRADQTMLDLCMSWRMLEVGGILVIDDTHLTRARRRRHDPKTKEAVKAFRDTHFDYEVLYDVLDQIAFRKKRARLPRHPDDPHKK